MSRSFSRLAHYVTNLLIDNSFVRQAFDLTESAGGIQRFSQGIVSSFVPLSGFWRTMNRTYEVLTKGSAYEPENKSLASRLLDSSPSYFAAILGNRIPNLDEAMPKKVNIWGKPISYQGGVFRQWLPVKWSEETKDPVDEYLMNLDDFYPSLPQHTIEIKGRTHEIPPKMYRDYITHYGAILHDALGKVIGSSGFKSLSTERQELILRRIEARISNRERRKLRIMYIKEQRIQ
jgi:hypothetical protein